MTGGAGFIGAHTTALLLERGYRVRIFDWLQPPVHLPGVRPRWLSDDAELQVGDVRDKEAMRRALTGVDSVIHLAAYQDYLPDFSTFFHTNTVGTALLYELAVEMRLALRKVVVASSQAAYGEGRYHCDQHQTVYPDIRPEAQLRAASWEVGCPICAEPARWEPTDEAEVNPQNQYGLSKYTQELVSFSLGRRYGIHPTCMRYSITQGRWQSPRNAYSGICRIFTLRALAGKAAIVYEDGEQLRDYVYVGDVARANLLALEDSRTDFLPYNVGGERALTALDYAQTVLKVVGSGGEPELPGYYRFGDTRHIVSDTGRLRALGWATTKSVEEIVAEYAGWVTEEGITDTTTDASITAMFERGSLRRTDGSMTT